MIKLKKLLLLILIIILMGCSNKNIVEKENVTEKIEIVGNQLHIYKDFNETPIGIYKNKEKIEKYKTSIKIGRDIAIFNIFPSDSNSISYNYFGEGFNKEWIKYNNNLKIGFNLKYTTDDMGNISHTILNVEEADDYQGYILVFLYDDYDIYKNNRVYSHVEKDKENTIYSSIKLYPQSAFNEINSKIVLTVFTYDDLEDFDENKEYRGNSKYSIEICDINKTC